MFKIWDLRLFPNERRVTILYLHYRLSSSRWLFIQLIHRIGIFIIIYSRRKNAFNIFLK